MRHDPIEFAPAADPHARRDGARRSPRTETAAGRQLAGQSTLAPNVLDEAFSSLERDETRSSPADPPCCGDLQAAACAALSGAPVSEPDNLSLAQLSTTEQRIQRQRKLVESLAAQLVALGRQREQLARLLQDIDSSTLAGRAET